MKKLASHLTASTLAVTLTLMGCGFDAGFMAPVASASTRAAGSDHAALRGEAMAAVRSGDLAKAMELMEQAVAASPRDAGYRLLLADIYMKSGRFQSAETTYADVLEIDTTNFRAGLSLALTRIAAGRAPAALGVLDEIAGRGSPADVGLAYALAGRPDRGIEILEPAARAFSASPRVRQNLALAYALKGDWARARTVAAQDLSPAEVGPRLQQWAQLAHPEAASTRVAQIMGVQPVADPGQPVRLALNAAPEPVPADTGMAFAEAEAVYDQPVEFAEAGPVEFAQVEPVEIPVAQPVRDSEPAAAEMRYAAAAEALVRPEPAVIRTLAPAAATPAPVFERAEPRISESRGPGRYAVQIGAFSNEANAERAWVKAERELGLSGRQPLTVTIDAGGRTLHRVAIAGFDRRSDAVNMCQTIRARGGDCFVRGVAGDAPIRWASRYGPSRNA